MYVYAGVPINRYQSIQLFHQIIGKENTRSWRRYMTGSPSALTDFSRSSDLPSDRETRTRYESSLLVPYVHSGGPSTASTTPAPEPLSPYICRNGLFLAIEGVLNHLAPGWKYHVSNTKNVKDAWDTFAHFSERVCAFTRGEKRSLSVLRVMMWYILFQKILLCFVRLKLDVSETSFVEL